LNCINGFYRPQKGEIYFEGQRITRLRPDRIARLGVSRTFQNIQLYTGLNTVDNLMAARHFMFKSTWPEDALYFGRAHREEIKHRRVVEDIIDFLEIERYRKTVVGALPYGVRKRIDLGRALAQEPKFLLLDEPMAGMNVEEKEDMARFILDVQEERGITIVLIEHDMGVVMDITDRIMVIDWGRKIAEGIPDEVKSNPEVIKAYLGGEAAVPVGKET
jgi:branched-chain amino acid transport system ATP-binding protein